MKVIKSKAYKLAYTSVDDQPNYVRRDRGGQGSTIFLDPLPDSEDAIKRRWRKQKKKRRHVPDEVLDKMPQGSI